MSLSPSEIFKGRNIFFIGGTGFLGKVTLSMLLEKFPELNKLYLMVRAGASVDSEERFWTNVFSSPAFDPLRNHYGSKVEEYLRSKLIIVGGDITLPNLGYTDEQATKIASDIDLVLNSSGNVSFNPPLENALKTNVTGTMNLLSFVKRMKRPAFVHTSTCFVAGNRSGQIWEDDPVVGYFPRRDELKKVDFSVENELKDCERLIRNVVEESSDSTLNAEFRAVARKRLQEEGRDPDDEHTLNLAAARERKDWIRNRMSQMGLQRAQWWGWPNIYTYTKSMGEQLIAAESGIVRAIIRPSIVESSLQYPFAGWNEGFNTTAPLIAFGLNGQNVFPVNNELVLDIIPVDYVASAILTIAAQACVQEPKLVYQLSSGDVNPQKMRRIVTLLGLYKRKHFQQKEDGNRFVNAIAARMEAKPMEDDTFRKFIPPLHRKLQKMSDWLGKTKSYGTFQDLTRTLKKGVDHLEAFTREGLDAYEQFRPFMVENEYQFRADHVRELFASLDEPDRKRLTWAPETIDWYSYWLKIHFPGLQKWVFPKMEEIGKPKPKRIYTYRNLNELFDAVTKLYKDNIAITMRRGGTEEQYTYGDLRELSLRAASFLYGEGVRLEDRIALIGENSPEWGICYFAIIKSGATCIPVDKDLSEEEIVNILRSGDARGLILTDKIHRKHSSLSNRLLQMGLNIKIWRTSEIFQLGEEAVEQERTALLPKAGKPGGIASLIFTSGTTGKPKGVMLTQKNLTSMVSQLLKIYDVSDEDGFLSVLPLHHTFEFSTGFLLPFSRGAQITYLEDLNGEEISHALKQNHVTIMVGVPALWDLLRRRILNKFGEKSEKLQDFVEMLVSLNGWLRKKTPVNLGPFLFFPVHHGLGGKIRYLISGGSTLSKKVADTFHGLGFALNEGYGLTEASPVLTVTRPNSKHQTGSVGQPLPGVEIRIHEPDENGIGEVIARGPNVMSGYYLNPEATSATLIDGWLHTGDLGHLDDAGNLFLVGRSKDLIVPSSGKNVYPDELEELYRHHPLIKELSIVGLPDEDGERVACLIVPDYEAETNLSHAEIKSQLEEHFRTISANLPYYKRVKTLEFTDQELPRTGTRKVKRAHIISRLQHLLAKRTAEPLELAAPKQQQWLMELIATVSGKPISSIHSNTTFDALGFDSLMYTELAAALEASGRKVPSLSGLIAITNIRELAEFLSEHPLRGTLEHWQGSEVEKQQKDIVVPELLSRTGHLGLDAANKIFFEVFMNSKVTGKNNVPAHTNFIVVANHSSHLDTGLVKFALGDAGNNLATVAAADYFFDHRLKRAFFENFTNLLPMQRQGSLQESLKVAAQALQQGFNLLIFPEGTRSQTGKMADFKFSLGYLSYHTKKGILPLHLSGTYDALPKGRVLPKSRDLSAAIGPLLPYEKLEKLTAGLPKNEAYRMITIVVQKMVEQLQHGNFSLPDLDSLRQQWNRDHQPRIEQTASVMGD